MPPRLVSTAIVFSQVRFGATSAMPRQIFSVNYFCLELAPVAVGTACALAALATGCSGGPARVEAPSWDPEGIADRILETLDKDANGSVSAEELAASPGLAAGSKPIDANGDGALSRDELVARFEKYAASRVGVNPTNYTVLYKGRPVSGATVEFIPEAWLGGVIEPARGTTDETGSVYPLIDDPNLPGIRLGFYRVKITSPTTKIPERYSSDQSPLGVNVSTGDPDAGYADKRLILTDS
jgi:hypothetical protein